MFVGVWHSVINTCATTPTTTVSIVKVGRLISTILSCYYLRKLKNNNKSVAEIAEQIYLYTKKREDKSSCRAHKNRKGYSHLTCK